MSEQQRFFREHKLPDDGGWRLLEDVPADLLRLLEIYATALKEENDREERFGTIDDFYKVFDQFNGDNRCFVAGVNDEGRERITTVANIEVRPTGVFFGEGIATTQSARGLGMGSYVIEKLLEVVRKEGAGEMRFRAQQRVVEMYKSMGARLLESPDKRWPLMVFDVDQNAA